MYSKAIPMLLVNLLTYCDKCESVGHKRGLFASAQESREINIAIDLLGIENTLKGSHNTQCLI